MPHLEGFPAIYRADDPNVPISGYLFSMDMEQAGTRRKVKPLWRIDVCVALPDERTVRKGGGAR